MKKYYYLRLLLLILGLVLFLIPGTLAEHQGTFGNSLIWHISDSGVLTISGQGEMPEYNPYPWADYKNEIKSVVIQDGITNISSRFISNYMSVTSVSIPDSVLSIGYHAFYYCERISEIVVPPNVKTIGESAFEGCSGLVSIQVSDANEYFSSCDGVLFDKSMTTLLNYPARKSDESYSVPESVTEISKYAFYFASKLKNVELPQGITKIGASAFALCNGLESINLPNGLAVLDSSTFSSCYKLTNISLPSGLRTIGYNAFYCAGLTELHIPEGTTTIGDNAFYANNFTAVEIPESVTSIGSEAFLSCHSLKDVSIPGTTLTIGTNAFKNCSADLQITVIQGSPAEDYVILNNLPYTVISSYDYTVFDGTVRITKYTGDETAVTIPERIGGYPVSAIYSGAFINCEYVEEVFIRDHITLIQGGAFPTTNSPKIICYRDSAAQTYAERYGIPYETVRKIISSGKQGNVEWSIDADGCLVFSGNGPVTSAVSGEYSKVVFEEGITGIFCSFSGNKSITEVTFSNTVTEIGASAFYGCTSLQSLSFPETLNRIGGSAFAKCTGLQSLIVPKTVKFVGIHAFAQCAFTDVILAAESIELQAFYQCTQLKNLTIAEGVKNIGDSAFLDCFALTNLTIGEGVPQIGSNMFYNCNALEAVTIPGSVSIIGESAFSSCDNLQNVIFGDGVEQIGSWAFSGCNNLNGLTIPESVVSIGSAAFSALDESDGVYLSDYITEIGLYAFGLARIYTSLDSETAKALGKQDLSFRIPGEKYDLIYLYTDDTITGLEIKSADKNIQTVSIPEGVTGLGSSFYNCTELTRVALPETLAKLEENVFSGCTSLTEIHIPDKVKEIPQFAFYNCSNLAEITFSDSLTTIGDWAFYKCSLTEITFPDSLTTIGNYAFSGCGALTRVTIPVNVTSIGNNSFGYSLKTILTGCNSYADQYFTAKQMTVTRVEEMTDPVSGHNWADPVYTWSEDHLTLNAERICLLDQAHQRSETVGASGEQTKDPGCETPGETTYTSYEFSNPLFERQSIVIANIPALGHSPATAEAVESTCTSTGLTSGTYCSVCGKIIVEQEIIPKKEHNTVISSPRVEPGCTTTGLTEEIYCTTCNQIISYAAVIPETGHTSFIVPAVSPTSNSSGLTEGICCSTCGIVIKEQLIIPPKRTISDEGYSYEGTWKLRYAQSGTKLLDVSEREDYKDWRIYLEADGHGIDKATSLGQDDWEISGGRVVYGGVPFSLYSSYPRMIKLSLGDDKYMIYQYVNNSSADSEIQPYIGTWNAYLAVKDSDGVFVSMGLLNDSVYKKVYINADNTLYIPLDGSLKWGNLSIQDNQLYVNGNKSSFSINQYGQLIRELDNGITVLYMRMGDTNAIPDLSLYVGPWYAFAAVQDTSYNHFATPIDGLGNYLKLKVQVNLDGTIQVNYNGKVKNGTWSIQNGAFTTTGLEDKVSFGIDNNLMYNVGRETYLICSGMQVSNELIASTMPNSLTSIEEEAFLATSINRLIVSSSCRTIGKNAFSQCANLSIIYLPKSVRNIDSSAFGNRTDLLIICESGSAGARFAEAHNIPYAVR